MLPLVLTALVPVETTSAPPSAPGILASCVVFADSMTPMPRRTSKPPADTGFVL